MYNQLFLRAARVHRKFKKALAGRRRRERARADVGQTLPDSQECKLRNGRFQEGDWDAVWWHSLFSCASTYPVPFHSAPLLTRPPASSDLLPLNWRTEKWATRKKRQLPFTSPLPPLPFFYYIRHHPFSSLPLFLSFSLLLLRRALVWSGTSWTLFSPSLLERHKN